MADIHLEHPTVDTLSALLDEKIQDSELKHHLEEHLQQCSQCRATMEQLLEDPLIQAVQNAQSTAFKAEYQVTLSMGGAETNSETCENQSSNSEACPEALVGHPQYEFIQKLGSGGMGSVYLTRHRVTQRLEAIKVIHPQLLAHHPEFRDRFIREIRALSQLKHENIIGVYSAEEVNNNLLLVMEFLEGDSLDKVVEREGCQSVRVACEYIRQAALGLQHAHEQHFVHRDIKPQNLMRITQGGLVKLLDFGLTKQALEAQQKTDNQVTGQYTVLGTPAYMAPEQVEDFHQADIRSDIYSLGCTLYYLLSGHPPFESDNLSSLIYHHSHTRPKKLSEIRKDIPRNLTRVVNRMLEKDPSHRYQQPIEVAHALEPFVHPKKRRWAWASVALLALLPVILFWGQLVRIVTNQGQIVIETDAHVEVSIKQNGERIKLVDTQSNKTFDIQAGQYTLHVRELPDGVHVASRSFAVTRGGKEVINVRLELSKANPVPPSTEGVSFSSSSIVLRPRQFADNPWTIEFSHHRGPVHDVSFSPDGTLLATAGQDGTVRIWQSKDFKLTQVLCKHSASVNCLAWHAQGMRLASGDSSGVVCLWDISTGSLIRSFDAHNNEVGVGVSDIEWSPTEEHVLASSGWDRTLRIWRVDRAEIKPKELRHDGPVVSLQWAENGKAIFSCGKFAGLHRWTYPVEVAQSKPKVIIPGPLKKQFAIQVHLLDSKIYLATREGQILVLDEKDGKLIETLLQHQEDIAGISPIGEKHLLSGGYKDGKLIRWERNSDKHQLIQTFTQGIRSISVQPGKAALIAVSVGDNNISIVDPTAGKVIHTIVGTHHQIGAMAFHPQGKSLAFSDLTEHSLYLIDQSPGIQALATKEAKFYSLVWSKTGKWLAAGTGRNNVYLWDQDRKRSSLSIKKGTFFSLVFSSDDSQLAGGTNTGEVHIWDIKKKQLLHTVKLENKPIRSLAWNSKGVLACAVEGVEKVVLIDTTKDSPTILESPNLKTYARSVAWSTDGQKLLVGSRYGLVQLWDLNKGQSLWSKQHHTGSVIASYANWSHSTPFAITSGEGGKVQQIDLASGKIVRTLSNHPTYATAMSMSPNGILATGGNNGLIRFIDMSKQAIPVGTAVLHHSGEVFAVDGKGHYLNTIHSDKALIVIAGQKKGGQRITPFSTFHSKVLRKTTMNPLPFLK